MRITKALPVLGALAVFATLAATPNDAQAWSCCKSLTKFVSNTASAAGSFASSTYNKASKAVASTAGKAWDTVSTGAKAVGSTIKSGANAVGNTVKQGVKVVKDTATKGYKAATKYAKQGWTTLSSGAKKTWGYAKQGAQWVGKKTQEGAKWVGDKAKAGLDWAKDKFNLLAKYGQRVLAGVKRTFDKYIKPLVGKMWDMGKNLLNQMLEQAKAQSPAMREVINTIQGKQSVADAVGNLEAAYGEAGKAKLVGYLTKVAMKLLTPPIKAVIRFATNLLLKALQTPLAHAIAHALSTGIASAVAAVTAGIGAFLKPVLQPLTKWTADKMLDWLREKVKDKVADFIWSKSQGLVESYLIRPLVNRSYDGLLGVLKRKFPNVFGKVGQVQATEAEAQ